MTTTVPIYNVRLVRDGSLRTDTRTISNSTDAAEILQTYLDGPDREHFVVLLLSTKNRLVGVHTAHIGAINQCPVCPREIFKAAILANAAAIIVGHNHPSGDPTPSRDDIRCTKELATSADLLGINFLDHIIIGDPGVFCSLKERGLF